MRSFDLTPLLRSTIGFENLSRLVDLASGYEGAENAYPPYNIEKRGEDSYRISMAVAGFKRDEIEITVQENLLTVQGRAADQDDSVSYLHRGIAKRAFERRFQLADSIRVTGASLVDGLLNLELLREVPEHKKPRNIEIETVVDGGQKLTAKKAA